MRFARLLDLFLARYGQPMPSIAPRLEVVNRLGRAMTDPTRSRILLRLLEAQRRPGRSADEPLCCGPDP